eukprot:5557939-Prymnesium_polylepis.1
MSSPSQTSGRAPAGSPTRRWRRGGPMRADRRAARPCTRSRGPRGPSHGAQLRLLRRAPAAAPAATVQSSPPARAWHRAALAA